MQSIPGESYGALFGSLALMLAGCIPIIFRKRGWARGRFGLDATAIYLFISLIGVVLFISFALLKWW